MTIYIAAPWADKDKMEAIALKFEAEGHTITHRWWQVENLPEVERSPLLLRKQAQQDIDGVKSAQMLVLINSSKSEGKALEQGVAISWRKPILAIGKRGEHSGNVFHYLPNYLWVETVEDALKSMDCVRWLLQEGLYASQS